MRKRHIIEVGSRKYNVYLKILDKHKDIVLEVFEPLDVKASILEYFRATKLNYFQQKRFIINRFALSDEYNKEFDFNITNPLDYSSMQKLNYRGVLLWNQNPENKNREISTISTQIVKTKTLNSCLFKNRYQYKSLKIKDTIDSININIKGDAIAILKGIGRDYIKRVNTIRVKILNTNFDLYENQSELCEIEYLLNDFKFKVYKKVDCPSTKEIKITFVNERFFE